MHPKDADGMANSVDPDQTASAEAVWSWCAVCWDLFVPIHRICTVNGVVWRPRNVHVSKYVVSVASSALIQHRSYPWFVCFLCWFTGGLGNRANQMFWTTAEAMDEGLDLVKHV